MALAALGQISVPGPPVEATSALFIVFLSVKILKHRDGQPRPSRRYLWGISFSFGLLHGLGSAGALGEIGPPDGEIPAALLAFNLGVKAGQLDFVAVVLMAMVLGHRILSRLTIDLRESHPVATSTTGYAIGCVATFWLIERGAALLCRPRCHRARPRR